MKNRCKWCNTKNQRYIEYHDNEWGTPCFSDHNLFEMLILESFHAGLSWECVLNKREYFREAYDNFHLEKVMNYGEDKKRELANNPLIIRNKLKIKASVKNAQIFYNIIQEYGSFYNYIIKYTGRETIYEIDKINSEISDAISKDLYNRGMRFVGTVIIYSYLQAVGFINAHDENCYLYKYKRT